jgi:type I restriction enzyme R subunit
LGVVENIDAFTTAGDPCLNLALAIDETIKQVRPDGWRDNGGPKEQTIKAALYGLLQSEAEVERIFMIVKAQKEY